MVITSIAPANETLQTIFKLTWPLDREHCLYFMDAVMTEASSCKGEIGELLLCDEEEDIRKSVFKDFVETRDIFATVGEKEFKQIAIILVVPDSELQIFIELAIDSEYCNVQLLYTGKDEDVDISEYIPDTFLDAVEILTHVAYTVNHIERES